MKHTRRGLIVRNPWCDLLVSGAKTWELRGSRTNIRGRVDIILAKSGHIVGSADLIDCIGPLSYSELFNNKRKHRVGPGCILLYKNTYAWVFDDAERFDVHLPYKHPRGAVIWVRL